MFRTLLRAALACLLLVCSSAWAGTVLVWGDSLSAGYGLRQQQSWPALLGERISAARLPPTR